MSPKLAELPDEVARLRECLKAFCRLSRATDVQFYLRRAIQELADFGSNPLRGYLRRADHWCGEARTEPAARRSGLDACIRQVQLDVRRLAESSGFGEAS